ncbi:helix-turn-helix domain-containing protein [Virgibacillus sp. W0430]|uniref:helix-turn-helix domain-containing protein n=1 Tax=Virgibacillus sp. W0430 TaxID=3391580 RepID=UPI003F461BEC
MSKLLGEQVRELRKKKQMTLKQVAEKTGFSISFISQLEHAKTSATLESLKKISEALGVTPSYFFSDTKAKTKSKVIRNVLNASSGQENNFIYKDLSGNVENPILSPNLIILNPGGNRGSNLTHSGQEFLYVLEGTLTVMIREETYDLHPYDCILIDSSTPHYWLNKTDEPIKFLCVSANGER